MERAEKIAWLTILANEIAFMAATRILLAYFPDEIIAVELSRTGLRLLSAFMYWRLLPTLLRPRQGGQSALRPTVVFGIVLIMMSAFLTGPVGSQMSAQAQWIFALTSIAVGIKEEIAFRALIQNLLVPRIGRAQAILVTMMLFTLFHVGVVPPLRHVYIHIALAGLFFGLVFEFTQRLWLVIALHALFDAVLALACTLPFDGERSALGFLLMLGALVSAAFWRWRVMRPEPNGSQGFRQSARVE